MEPEGTARWARIAGLCYLLVIAGGLSAELVRGSLVVPGDARATAEAIAEGESLWRSGLVIHLLFLIAAIVVNVVICELLRPVQATLARLALVFAVTGVAIEAMSLLHLYTPLSMIEESGALGGLDEGQRQALAYVDIGLYSTGYGIALAFFAGFCVLTGVLIRRSRLVPRVIGTMMVLAGAGYLINTVVSILSPPLSNLLFPWIVLPALPAELSLALWLVAKGVRTEPDGAGRIRGPDYQPAG